MKTILLAIFLSVGLVSGQVADFSLSSVPSGKTFRLSEAKGKIVALHFLLKTECPNCLLFTSVYKKKGSEIPDLIQVFIKPDAEADILKWSGHVSNGAPDIYRDPDAKLAESLGVPDGYAFHGQTVHYPATILLDRNGVEFFRYVGKSNRDRLPFETFASEIEKIKSR